MEYNIYDGHSNNSCRLAAVTNDTKGCIATSGIRIPVSSNNWKFQMDKTILVACHRWLICSTGNVIVSVIFLIKSNHYNTEHSFIQPI